ncbi:putative repeat protein (TIGR01451 family)/fimbrial isopeptide formation D2 family protein [Diaminobutyricimonas aerilata]|uniref:Putative repeat protein (TIGR01451 family)/fimbrial isopeptide formation D2 family protein n=1 Tax=Diaminobutyricimonas aerilata TaxID=1162967 RepID=A0A2M9CP50_9MICO|nr:SdrD B-like domain-containing protein [Diaminobutyricimonas aerilata]PJJ73638.1 putative repeat protein (TIGR01451 family)/fimbrial isopeptide formation D2 family protein [Diaminobutyricimonas aerilata]
MSAAVRISTVLALVAASLVAPFGISAAMAAGTPDVQLTKTVDGETLYGDDVAVELRATQTTGPAAYNLSFSDVIPPGTSIAASDAPVTSTITLPDGSKRVVWTNVSDLLTGAVSTFHYTLRYDRAVHDVGAVLGGTAGAFVNTDEREIPDFDPATGNAVAGSYSGSSSAAAQTTLVPFLLEKEEPNAEAELLRGVHRNKTVYTLTITNNTVNSTTGFSVVDYLPAGLEFLGCANVDNSAAGTEEYPGAGRIDGTPLPAMTDCLAPSSVTTVTTDPDGAGDRHSGVYTRVEWTGLGTLAAGAELEIQYAAAIPLQANVQSAGPATANLDNNTGPLTADEQSLVNYAVASGTYQGRPYAVDDTEEVVAEDVSVHKAVDEGTIRQGQRSHWTLTIESSEYAGSTSTIRIVDTIPDGLEFDATSAVPAAASVVIDPAEGTTEVTWELTGFTEEQQLTEVTYETVTLPDYRASGVPVSSEDHWTNINDLSTTGTVITDRSGTTGERALVDESSARQEAEPVTLTKEVAQPVAGVLQCGDGTALSFSDDVAGPFHPGDRVCFRLTVDFPGSLDTIDSELTDFLPEGFAFESVVPTAANDVEFDFSGEEGQQEINWTFDDADVGQHFEVVVQARIVDPAAAREGDITANLFKMAHKNALGETFQLRDQADVLWEEPQLALDKGIVAVNGTPLPGAPVASATIQAADEVTYRVTVTNSGGQDAIGTSVRDVLPARWSCDDIAAAADFTCVETAGRDHLQWDGLTVPADSSITLEYVATVPGDSSPGDSFANTAGVRTYQGATNTGTPFDYFPDDNIDPTLVDRENTDRARDDATVSLEQPTIVKGVTSPAEAGNTASQATIGENVTYTVTATVPEGTTLYETVEVRDTLDSRLQIIGTPTYTIGGGAAQNATVNGQQVVAPLPVGYVNAPDSGDDLVVLTIQARVLDVPAAVRGASVPNNATFVWSSVDGADRSVQSNQAPVTVVEPLIAVAKTNNAPDGRVAPGQTVHYTVTVSNGAAPASTAHDTVVVDRVPIDLTPLEATDDPAEDGDTVGGGVWNAGARTLTWTVPALVPSQTVTLGYDAQVLNPTVSNGTIVNDVTATTTSLAGEPTGERTNASLNGKTGSGYVSTSSSSVRAPEITLDKAVTPTTATIGERVQYTVTVTIPAAVIAYDTTVIDALPADIRFDGLDSATCTQGGQPCAPAITPTVIGTPAADARSIGFFLGDLDPAGTQARTVTLMYGGVVTGGGTAGETQTNTARVYFNTDDTITGTPTTVPAPGGFDTPADSGTATVTLVEPRLVVGKSVDGQVGDADARRAVPGDTLTYRVAVTNTGTSPAYDVVVTDTPDRRLTGYLATLPAGVVAVDADPSDGTLRWSIDGPIAPGATVEIAYSATVPAGLGAADEIDGPEIVNTVDIPTYAGVPDTGGNPDRYRIYTDVVDDTVNVELDLATIGDRVWFDADTDGEQETGEPGIAGATVTVVFAGADGVLGNGDDETHTTMTDAEGDWSVTRLPGGTYRATVTGTPAGYVPSYDLDGTTVTPNGQWQGALAQNGARTDVDFGYTGTGALGDLVWFDRNDDGVQQPGEPGLADQPIRVILLGGPGTADDVVYTTTTDAQGRYTVPRLAPGAYTVELTDTPGGFGFGSGASATLNRTLGVGQTLLDADFPLLGDLTVGDRVWLDRDGDGVDEATEPGIDGAGVEVRWSGLDGEFGTADDGVFPTTTDDTGAYAVGNLPAGEYRVSVTGSLPAGVQNTYDRDGDRDSVVTAEVTASDTTFDFGYYGDTGLGDVVWWDRDRDGVQEAGEPGIGGVDVQARFFGADGLENTADDLVFPATTSADGAWSIGELPEGRYRVTVTGAPAGFVNVSDPDGLAGADGVNVLDLGDGGNLAQDFGFSGDSSIGDLVWFDRDGDGAQGTDEAGIPGVTVTLTWLGRDGVAGGGDDVVYTATTDESGAYRFDGLPTGSFTVAVESDTLPEGMEPVSDRDGDDSPNTTTVTIAAPATVTDADFGYRGTGSIGDNIWHDRDADGTIDDGENGIPGVQVRVTWAGADGDLGTADDAVFTTTTDTDGRYLVEGLPAGDFTVAVDAATVPAGMTATFEEDGTLDARTPVTLADGAEHRSADFGFRGVGALGDRIWFDRDGDGVQDGGEPGVPEQPVTLVWAGVDGALGTDDDESWTTRTDEQGAYAFPNLPAGAYRVTVDGGIANAATATGDPDGGADATAELALAAGATDLEQDFGFVGDNTLGDLVWWDLDGDGVRADGEPGSPGVELTVTWAGPDGEFGTDDDIAQPATTDADGAYLVPGLPDGAYRVDVASGVYPGLEPTTDPADVTLEGGVERLDLDFGFVGSGSIGDTVWLDLDGDGTLDEGEPGIPGVTVTLTWSGPDGIAGNADDVQSTTTTDADGGYLFPRLPAGGYSLQLDGVPADLTATADPDGGEADASSLELEAGAEVDDQDFGYTGSASLGDLVWLDVDGDGERSGNEPGVGGVPVTVELAGDDGVLGTDDDIVIVTVTDEHGGYRVSGLPAGAVRVAYDRDALDAGYQPASDRDGGDAVTTELTLASGDAIDDVNFVIAGTSALSGVVFDDVNGDGVRQPGERGVPGVTLTVVWSGPDGPVAIKVTTDADGAWSLERLPSGTWTVTIDPNTVPDGYRVSTVGIVTVDLPVGQERSVIMGVTSFALAATGTTPELSVALALLTLLGGAVLMMRARRTRRA